MNVSTLAASNGRRRTSFAEAVTCLSYRAALLKSYNDNEYILLFPRRIVIKIKGEDGSFWGGVAWVRNMLELALKLFMFLENS